jgi:phage shock protein PspC (stress-responsive transcriptional regulator)
MRPIGLVRVAAEAEGLRLRHHLSRTVVRLVVGLIGLGFLTAAVTFAHLALWFWLRTDRGWVEYSAAGALAGGDLVLALILILVAARSSPGRIEREALEIRQRALSTAASTLATATVVVPLVRMVLGMMRRQRD